MNSTKLTNLILARHGSRPDVRLWRNETAGAWVGKKVAQVGSEVTIRHARMIQAGLVPGSADLIGFKRVAAPDDIIVPDVVPVARFVALEVKTGNDRPTKKQRDFLALVQEMGGIAGVVRSVEDVDALLGPPLGEPSS